MLPLALVAGADRVSCDIFMRQAINFIHPTGPSRPERSHELFIHAPKFDFYFPLSDFTGLPIALTKLWPGACRIVEAKRLEPSEPPIEVFIHGETCPDSMDLTFVVATLGKNYL